MKINTKQIAVMQVLPHLNSGGLVSGAVEIAKELVHSNFKSLIVSSGGYKENDPVLPINNYAWSKLGGEASVMLYKKSLILRLAMSEKPFVHDEAFKDAKSNF